MGYMQPYILLLRLVSVYANTMAPTITFVFILTVASNQQYIFSEHCVTLTFVLKTFQMRHAIFIMLKK